MQVVESFENFSKFPLDIPKTRDKLSLALLTGMGDHTWATTRVAPTSFDNNGHELASDVVGTKYLRMIAMRLFSWAFDIPFAIIRA